MKRHYVYRLTISLPNDPRKYYVGKHSGELDDFETGKYKTSSLLVRKILNEKVEFKSKIVKIFNTSKEALEFESKYHKRLDVENHEKFFNMQNQESPEKYKHADTTGLSVVKDIILDKIVVIPKEEFEANRDRYEGVAKNKKRVFDKQENKRKIISKEEFEANRDRYEAIKTNKVNVVENGKIFYVSKEEYSTGKYKHFLCNTVTAFDTVEEKYKVIPREEYHNNRDRYKHSSELSKSNKKYRVFNMETKLYEMVTKEDYENFYGIKYLHPMDKQLEKFGIKRKSVIGTVSVFDKITKEKVRITKEDYHNNRDRYLNCNSKEYKNLYKNK